MELAKFYYSDYNHYRKHPGIKSILALPYLNAKIETAGYDATLYPPLERVPARLAILRRNQWMVEESDVLIAYVTHGWGGAAATLKYTRQKKKRVILYPQFHENGLYR